MKFSSISANRSLVLALIVGGTLGFGVAGVTHAQYDTSGQGSSAGASNGQGSSTQPSRKDPYSVTKEKMDTGYVDQKKKGERATDPASPSKDTHVPEFSLDKEGKPIKDPMYEQGGPIGPN